jgi:DNA helicase-2/ATP-dependent DNA helicase PcrA
MTPSPLQQNIANCFSNENCNIVIDALAGSGKTTLLKILSNLIPADEKAAFSAFNKSIADELKEKISKPNVEIGTMHSFGWKAIIRTYLKPVVKNNKIGDICYNFLPSWSASDGVQLGADYLQKIKKIVDLARLSLADTEVALEAIAERHDIELTNGECKRALEVLRISNQDKKNFDFTDMIYIAATDPRVKLNKYNHFFVDECQDLSLAQQLMIEKSLLPGGRFVAVGDKRQAIYGFAGADSESFETLCNKPNTLVLPLSVNYRCAKSIIKLAQSLVPNIQAHDGAIEGLIDFTASYRNIKQGDFVLCRNTAPLVKLCLQFIREGRKAYVKGGDIGTNLLNIIKKSKADTIEELKSKLTDELFKIFDKLKKKFPYLSDEDIKAENAYFLFYEKRLVINTIINSGVNIKSVQDVSNCIASIFADEKEGIIFSTVHKAKGLESNNVYIICPELMPSKRAKKQWQKEQEQNLIYVAYTRAKQYLGFVTDFEFQKKKKVDYNTEDVTGTMMEDDNNIDEHLVINNNDFGSKSIL